MVGYGVKQNLNAELKYLYIGKGQIKYDWLKEGSKE